MLVRTLLYLLSGSLLIPESLEMPLTCKCPDWQYCSGTGLCRPCTFCSDRVIPTVHGNCRSPLLCDTGQPGPECPKLTSAVGVENVTIEYNPPWKSHLIGVQAMTSCLLPNGSQISPQLSCTGMFGDNQSFHAYWEGETACVQTVVTTVAKYPETTGVTTVASVSDSTTPPYMIPMPFLITGFVVVLLVLICVIVAGAVVAFRRCPRKHNKSPKVDEKIIKPIQASEETRAGQQHEENGFPSCLASVTLSNDGPVSSPNGSTHYSARTPLLVSSIIDQHTSGYNLPSPNDLGVAQPSSSTEELDEDHTNPKQHHSAQQITPPSSTKAGAGKSDAEDDTTQPKQLYDARQPNQGRVPSSVDLHQSLDLLSVDSEVASPPALENTLATPQPNEAHLLAAFRLNSNTSSTLVPSPEDMACRTGAKHVMSDPFPTQHSWNSMPSNSTAFSSGACNTSSSSYSREGTYDSSSFAHISLQQELTYEHGNYTPQPIEHSNDLSSREHDDSFSSLDSLCRTSRTVPSDNIGTMSAGTDDSHSGSGMSETASGSHITHPESEDSGISNFPKYSGAGPVQHSWHER